MDWVKRNLAFVIGSGLAVALMLLSGFYLFSNSKKNNDAREQLEGEYNELKRLHQLKPHPGKDDVDNISLAKLQKEELLQVIQKVGQLFEPIPAIPAATNVTGEQFSESLRRTINHLNRGAELSSVIVPTNYNFSFAAEKRLVKFAPGSLDSLSVQLGEVKAISEILFAAKVNKLTGLRRERVSPDDLSGPKSDYLTKSSVTNELAVITPYELSFESFSAELADVISLFANSPHGLVLKGVNVQPARMPSARGSRLGRGGTVTGTGRPIYTAPTYADPSASPYGGAQGASKIRRPTFNRSGAMPGTTMPGTTMPGTTMPGTTMPGTTMPGTTMPGTTMPGTAYAQPATSYRAAGAPTAAAQTLIDEHPLAVTMVVEVIKLLPPQEEF